jgi:CubicO group peptidase (beta-lactamase class C family)
VARLYAAPLGEVEDVRLVRPERLRKISAVAMDAVDQVFGGLSRLALGYHIGGPTSGTPNTPTVFGWSGVGRSRVSADTATGTTFALTKLRTGPVAKLVGTGRARQPATRSRARAPPQQGALPACGYLWPAADS